MEVADEGMDEDDAYIAEAEEGVAAERVAAGLEGTGLEVVEKEVEVVVEEEE